jgi:hypothetical protein
MKRVALTVAVAGIAIAAVVTMLEAPFAPWARSFGMWPTLTGNWSGTLEAPDGRTQPILLAIGGGVHRRGSTYIDGRARICDHHGAIREFEISGRPDNWRGTRFHLSFRPVMDDDIAPGPGDLRGEWNGDDIRATSTIVSRAPTATAEASRSSPAQGPPEARYVLRRGTDGDFLAACRERTQN